MKRLLIARHGNTFEPGETVRRIGVRSDLPLTNEGRAQAKRIASWLSKAGLEPHIVLTGSLQRTRCTAEIIAAILGYRSAPIEAAWLNEVDYGLDDGKPELEVVKRVGATALRAWDQLGEAVSDWPINREEIIRDCRHNIGRIEAERALLVTSNGLARFILLALGVHTDLLSLKMRTGGLAVIDMSAKHPNLIVWDFVP